MKYIDSNWDIRAVAIVQHNLDKPVLINLKREKIELCKFFWNRAAGGWKEVTRLADLQSEFLEWTKLVSKILLHFLKCIFDLEKLETLQRRTLLERDFDFNLSSDKFCWNVWLSWGFGFQLKIPGFVSWHNVTNVQRLHTRV